MAEFNDDGPALDYIRKRGYASYSSIKNVRDCEIPKIVDAKHFRVGTAVHSLLLEHKLEVELSAEEIWNVKKMLQALAANSIVISLLKKSVNEREFKQPINGLPILGYIDIDSADIGDLKTTRLTNKKAFIASMDFLQAAIYCHVTGKKNFIYIGVSKVTFEVFTFNVWEYPDRMKLAIDEMHRLTKYIKNKL